MSTNDLTWDASPSQYVNLSFYLANLGIGIVGTYIAYHTNIYLNESHPELATQYGIWIYLAAPAYMVIATIFKWVETSLHNYKIEADQFIETTGILNRSESRLELFRVKDISTERPLLLRLFGLGKVILHTSDKSSPVVSLNGISKCLDFAEVLRCSVNDARRKHGVREFD